MKKLENVKKSFLGLLSGFAFILILWVLFYGRTKAVAFISPWLQKIPKDDSKLMEITESVLGKATTVVNNENLKKATQKGSDFFENSSYAEPARDIRENVQQRIDEVIVSVKELPAQEIRTIKKQVCQQWMEEIATESASQ